MFSSDLIVSHYTPYHLQAIQSQEEGRAWHSVRGWPGEGGHAHRVDVLHEARGPRERRHGWVTKLRLSGAERSRRGPEEEASCQAESQDSF